MEPLEQHFIDSACNPLDLQGRKAALKQYPGGNEMADNLRYNYLKAWHDGWGACRKRKLANYPYQMHLDIGYKPKEGD